MKLRSLFAAAVLAASAVPAAAQPVKALPNGVEARTDVATLRVTALTDDILRVRVARGTAFPEDASWAVPRNVRMKSVPVRVSRTASPPARLQFTSIPRPSGSL